MPTYVTPGVYYETVDLDSQQISSIRTDVAAFIGIAERGPLHAPTPVTSFAQFQSVFGNFISQGYLAYSVKAFFENGGDRCHIVRVAAGAVSTATDGAAVQPADGHSSIVLSVTGFVPGAVVTVTRDAARQADHILKDVNAATLELIWQAPLEPALSGAPLTFDSGACASSRVFLDAAGKSTLRVDASSPGKWGNTIAVSTAHSNGAATLTRDAIQPADRLSSLVSSLTRVTKGALVKAFQDQGGGATVVEYHLVTSINPVFNRIYWDTALAPAFDITQPGKIPIYFETIEFTLSVSLQGIVSEVFTGLSLSSMHPQYVQAVVNAQSKQIKVTDLLSPSATPQNLPAGGVLSLRAGRDGIAALQLLDFAGMPGVKPKKGIVTLENVDEVAIVAVPDILIQPAPPPQSKPVVRPLPDPCALCSAPPQPISPPAPPLEELAPVFSLDQIGYVQQALINHCESMKYRIAVLDPPLFSPSKVSRDIAEIQSWRQRFDSAFAAIYFPWTLVYDPLQLGGNVVRAIPPSGHVAGTYANTDLTVGVHRAPANYQLSWVQDFLVNVDATIQGILNPAGINCLRTFPGRGLRIYGARTVSSDPSWRYVNVKRLMMMIEKSLETSLQWAVFEPNNATLRLAVSGAITVFLEAVYEAGALAGATDNQAFYVKCDSTNNPPELSAAGQFLAEVGVAPAIPAEFIVFRVGRTKDQLEVTE
jgi:phage tail sheath protein FI